MIYPSIDKLLQKTGSSKYLLVNIIARRSHEMKETGHYQLKGDEYKSVKDIGKALEEVNAGMIHLR